MLKHLNFQAESPSAGQFTALGIYLITCLSLVVAAMIEFAILLHLLRSSEERAMYQSADTTAALTEPEKPETSLLSSGNQKPEENFQLRKNLNQDVGGNTNGDSLLYTEKITHKRVDDATQKERRTFMKNAHNIDYFALLFFSLLFCIFIIIYWLYYLLL